MHINPLVFLNIIGDEAVLTLLYLDSIALVYFKPVFLFGNSKTYLFCKNMTPFHLLSTFYFLALSFSKESVEMKACWSRHKHRFSGCILSNKVAKESCCSLILLVSRTL